MAKMSRTLRFDLGGVVVYPAVIDLLRHDLAHLLPRLLADHVREAYQYGDDWGSGWRYEETTIIILTLGQARRTHIFTLADAPTVCLEAGHMAMPWVFPT